MKVNTLSNEISFSNAEEKMLVIEGIYKAFKIDKDRELSSNWLSVDENYQEFCNMLAELWVIRMTAMSGNYSLYEKAILGNKQFQHKLQNGSREVAKLSVIILTSFQNEMRKGQIKDVNQKVFLKVINKAKQMFEKQIDYHFEYNNKVCLPFLS